MLAPVINASTDLNTQVLPNEYIVVLRGGVRDVAGEAAVATTQGAQVRAVWEHALKGFAARLSPAALRELRRNPNVQFIEPDGFVRTAVTQSPVPSWGLDRIDQRNLPLDNSYTYNNNGSGVHAYIVDTGINPTHNEFTGRIGNGINFAGGSGTNDCNGHGTHVAGTVGGTAHGVAKGVTLHPVRVLDCFGSGQWTWYISGVNWIAANAIKPAVMNASLGGGINTGADQATNNLAAAGVVVNVASGNNNANACSFSPARTGPTAGVLSVNASTITDVRAGFSDFGTCSTIFAPGVNITSAWIGGNNATNTISGTSMATPHVAGAAALYLNTNPSATPAQVENALVTNATPGKITNPGTGSPNLLLYTGFIGGGNPGNQPPVANFSYTCQQRSGPEGPINVCTLTSTSTDPDNNIATYAWTAPNRPNKTGATITRQYRNPGSYPNTLTVTDAGGLSNSVTKNVVIP
jgi:subtilisin family serine protease